MVMAMKLICLLIIYVDFMLKMTEVLYYCLLLSLTKGGRVTDDKV